MGQRGALPAPRRSRSRATTFSAHRHLSRERPPGRPHLQLDTANSVRRCDKHSAPLRGPPKPGVRGQAKWQPTSAPSRWSAMPLSRLWQTWSMGLRTRFSPCPTATLTRLGGSACCSMLSCAAAGTAPRPWDVLRQAWVDRHSLDHAPPGSRHIAEASLSHLPLLVESVPGSRCALSPAGRSASSPTPAGPVPPSSWLSPHGPALLVHLHRSATARVIETRRL